MPEAPGFEHASVRIGLHFAAARRAAELAAGGLSRREVAEQLAPDMPAADDTRRRRIASAIARRMMPEGDGPTSLQQVVIAAGPSLDARHLLLYGAAAQEPLVLAIASEVFYERFVLGRTPGGLTEREYAALNTGQLLETDEVITHRLVDHYARAQWGLDDPTSTQCVLRILREGGALAATWMARGESRCLGYFPTHRGPGWRVFAHAVWDEFGAHGRRELPRAHLRSMVLARLFSLPGPVVEVLAERAAAEGFGVIDRRRSGGRLILAHRSPEEAAAALAGSYKHADEP